MKIMVINDYATITGGAEKVVINRVISLAKQEFHVIYLPRQCHLSRYKE